MSHTLTLVTGGSRSGKSRYAMETALQDTNRVFIATAQAFDKEMQARVQAHRAERSDRFQTIEEPTDLAGAIGNVPVNTDIILVDCLTVWIGNLMHKHGTDITADLPEISALLHLLESPPSNIILVTNEVGCGIIPENAMARRFRDLTGRVNQLVAGRADRVMLCVSGIPIVIKGD